MTRKEDIEEKAGISTFYLEGEIGTPTETRAVIKPLFVDMAEWADKTMMDAACKWLKENAFKRDWPSCNVFLASFRKAMEVTEREEPKQLKFDF